jgi:streptogramin lyase
MAALFILTIACLSLGTQWWSLGEPAHASHGFPHATVKVWDTAVPTFPSGSPGLTPGASVEDQAGLTGHGTSFPTIVTVYARNTNSAGPDGVSYWNPDSNLFLWYGKTLGFPTSVDINRGGPTLPGGPFGTTFGPGDVWIAGYQDGKAIVHIAGTNKFRSYATNSSLNPPSGGVWGVKVDEATGKVWGAQPAEERLSRLDPPSGLVTMWTCSSLLAGGKPCGTPMFVTVDSQGRPYVTLIYSDLIGRVNPGPDGVLGLGPLGTSDDTATVWQIPSLDGTTSFRPVGIPLTGSELYQNGNNITADADGNIWFTETNSNEIGRLSGGPDGVLGTADDLICEYKKPGLTNPQLIATTSSGALLQVYFTEGEGNSVSVLTQVEADQASGLTQVCTTVPPETVPLNVQEMKPDIFDEEVAPLQTTIVPTVHDVPGLDGSASGATRTATGEPIPPILRFSPMPNPLLSMNGTPIGDAGNGFPLGITGVYATNRIAGAYLKGNKHFEVSSGAIIAPPPPIRFEETDPSITFTGTWASNTNFVAWSGGSAMMSNVGTSRATFTFTGTAVSWISVMCEICGIADVFMDGTLAGTVDMYSATREQGAFFNATGLPAGSHTLVIEVTGTKNPVSGDAYIAVDAFDVTR